MKLKQLTFVLLMSSPLLSFSQAEIKVTNPGVSVNDNGNNSPDENTVLDVNSETKGVIFPRMTTAVRDQMGTDTNEGVLIYNLNEHVYQYWNGMNWINMAGEVFTPPIPVLSDLNITPDDVDIKLTLSWLSTDDSKDIEIYRQEAGGDFDLLTTLPAGTLSYEDIAVTFNTEYCYRVKYLSESSYLEDCSTAPTTMKVFGENLHAWFRSDHWTDNLENTENHSGNRLKALLDLSGNDRNLTQDNIDHMPFHKHFSGIPNAILDGYEGIGFQVNGLPKTYLTNNNNWAGLNDDPFFVLVVEYATPVSAGQHFLFADNTPNESFPNMGYANFVYYHGSSSDLLAIRPQTYVNNYANSHNTDGMHAFAAVYRTNDHIIWRNGVSTSSPFDYENSGTITASFDNIVVGNTTDLIGNSIGTSLFELVFIKGNPEDYPNLFNDIHNLYLADRYPSLGITDPGLN